MRAVFIAISVLLVSACMGGDKPELTPMELQSIQSRDFEATKKIAYASVISVFQDLGYIIESGDFDTGIVTAKSATKNTTGITGALIGVTSRENTKATAFIESFSEGRTRIRLNFIINAMRSGAYGQTSEEGDIIEDADVYQNAFERIDEAIFVRSGVS